MPLRFQIHIFMEDGHGSVVRLHSPSRRQGRKILKISVFGLGYVGTVSAGCLAMGEHEVVGVDPVQAKVDLINKGCSPIVEAEIGEIIAAAVESGRLRATGDPVE